MKDNIDNVILGANPFEGVSYLSQEHRTEYRERFSKIDNVKEIIDMASDFGINTISTGNNKTVIDAVDLASKDNPDLKVIPVIPSVYEYVKKSSLGGMGGLLDSIGTYNKFKLALKAPSLLKKGITKDVLGLFTDLFDIELEGFKNFEMPLIILHGVTADMAVSVNQPDMLSVFGDLVRKKFKTEPGIATHNFGKLMQNIENEKNLDYILAPFNKKGFMMNPSAHACIDIVGNCDKQVIGKKILAGGVIPPKDAFNYIFNELGMKKVMIGVGSREEAYETFKVAADYL